MSPISKRKRCDNEKTDKFFLFPYHISCKYGAEDKVTNKFNELHGKECSLQNDEIIWTSPIVTYDVKSSRENINMGRGNIFVSITKQ